MSDELIVEREVIEAARAMMHLKRAVIAWTQKEGKECRLVTNSQAPMWEEYVKAEERLARAMVEL